MIPALDVGQHGLVVVAQPGRDVLVVAPPRPFLGRRGQEDLHVGVGQHHGADVAALDHDAPLARRQLALQLHQPGPHRGHRRYRRHRLGHFVAADLSRNVFSGKVRAILVGVVADGQVDVRRGSADRIRVVQIDPGPQHRQRHDPVHRAGVQIACAQ